MFKHLIILLIVMVTFPSIANDRCYIVKEYLQNFEKYIFDKIEEDVKSTKICINAKCERDNKLGFPSRHMDYHNYMLKTYNNLYDFYNRNC